MRQAYLLLYRLIENYAGATMKNVFKKYFFVISLFCTLSIVLSGKAYGEQRPRWKTRPAENEPGPTFQPGRQPNVYKQEQSPGVNQPARQSKVYDYAKENDINGDGSVDTKDRLIWLREKKGAYTDIDVSDKNEALVDVMDKNGDGRVQSWEMEDLFNKYDTNEDKILEEEEIDAVVEKGSPPYIYKIP